MGKAGIRRLSKCEQKVMEKMIEIQLQTKYKANMEVMERIGEKES